MINYGIIKKKEALTSIKDFWERFQTHPSIDIDNYLLVSDLLEYVLNPYVITIEEDGKPFGLVIGRLQKFFLPIKIGYKTIFKIPFRSIVICHGGIIGEQSEETLKGTISLLFKELKERKVEMVLINGLDATSLFSQLIKRNFSKLWQICFLEKEPHWCLKIQGSYENYFDNLEYKVRKNLRRAERKLGEDGLGEITFEKIIDENSLDRFIDIAENIASKTYQRALGVGFKDSPEARRILHSFARKGHFRGFLLFADGKPIAFDMGLSYRDSFFWQFGGYDPVYRKYEPGTNLFLKALKYLLDEEQLKLIDFGQGEGEYKHHYCNHSWQEETICIFGPSFKGISSCIILNKIKWIEQRMESLLEKIKFRQKLKKMLRDLALKKNI